MQQESHSSAPGTHCWRLTSQHSVVGRPSCKEDRVQANNYSAHERLESGKENRVHANSYSAHEHLESGRENSGQANSYSAHERRESGREKSGLTVTRRMNVLSHAGRTAGKPNNTRRIHVLSRAGTEPITNGDGLCMDVVLYQNHVQSFLSLSFFRRQRDRAIFRSPCGPPWVGHGECW